MATSYVIVNILDSKNAEAVSKTMTSYVNEYFVTI